MAFPSGAHVSLRSSIFTATADARYRGSLVLVQIELPDYGAAPARTLRFTNAASSTGKWYVDPDGNPWEPVLKGSPAIDHGGSWIEVSWQPADAVIEVEDRRVSGQGESETFSNLFGSYPFIGAQVTIFQAFDNLTSTSEFQTIFFGEIAEVDSMDLRGVSFHCVQRRGWNVQFPARTVNVDDFPDAPKQVIGAAIPVVLGDWSDNNRYLQVGGFDSSYETYMAGIARGHCPMLVVESPTGTGVAAPRAIISDDEIDQGALAGGAPYDQWYMYESGLDCVVGGFPGTLANPTDGPADLTLLATPGSGPQVNGAILPIETHLSNTALYPDEMFRKDKDRSLTGFSYLNHTAVERNLMVWLPDIFPLGVLVSATVYCFYQFNGTALTVPKLRITNDATGKFAQASFPAATTGYSSTGFEAVLPLTVTVGDPASDVMQLTDPWKDLKNCYITVSTAGAGQEMKIHRLAVVVTYKPAARIERPGVQRDTKGPRISVSGRRSAGTSIGGGATLGYNGPGGTSTSADLVSFDNPLLGYPQGRKDTAAGIYTGTADALIQHPVDMVRYLLKRWASVPAGEIVENSGDFGAFPDAKTTLSGYTFRHIFSSRDDIASHIAQIGAESLCWFKRCPTLPGAPWVAIPWEIGSPVDYRSSSEPFVFYRARNHVVEGSFKAGFTRISGVSNIVRVNYDWDPRTNTYGDQLYITPTASRVAIGGLFGADSAREADAAASATLYGEKETVLSLKMTTNATTAYRTLARFFDLRVSPRLTVQFKTFVNAYDLNRGHVIAFASDWDDRLAYPKAGEDGSWEGKLFRVVNVKRLAESPAEYAVAAVEI